MTDDLSPAMIKMLKALRLEGPKSVYSVPQRQTLVALKNRQLTVYTRKGWALSPTGITEAEKHITAEERQDMWARAQAELAAAEAPEPLAEGQEPATLMRVAKS